MLLNPNESLLPSVSPSTLLPLESLQEILHNRIIQKKREMHQCNNKIYLENLRIEIETLQWVLTQILRLLNDNQPESTDGVCSNSTPNLLITAGRRSSDVYLCVNFAQQYGLDIKKGFIEHNGNQSVYNLPTGRLNHIPIS